MKLPDLVQKVLHTHQKKRNFMPTVHAPATAQVAINPRPTSSPFELLPNEILFLIAKDLFNPLDQLSLKKCSPYLWQLITFSFEKANCRGRITVNPNFSFSGKVAKREEVMVRLLKRDAEQEIMDWEEDEEDVRERAEFVEESTFWFKWARANGMPLRAKKKIAW